MDDISPTKLDSPGRASAKSLLLVGMGTQTLGS